MMQRSTSTAAVEWRVFALGGELHRNPATSGAESFRPAVEAVVSEAQAFSRTSGLSLLQ